MDDLLDASFLLPPLVENWEILGTYTGPANVTRCKLFVYLRAPLRVTQTIWDIEIPKEFSGDDPTICAYIEEWMRLENEERQNNSKE